MRWQGTRHQPDCIAALTVAHDVPLHSIGHMHIVSMADIERRAREGRMLPPPAWMRRRIGGR